MIFGWSRKCQVKTFPKDLKRTYNLNYRLENKLCNIYFRLRKVKGNLNKKFENER